MERVIYVKRKPRDEEERPTDEAVKHRPRGGAPEEFQHVRHRSDVESTGQFQPQYKVSYTRPHHRNENAHYQEEPHHFRKRKQFDNFNDDDKYNNNFNPEDQDISIQMDQTKGIVDLKKKIICFF